MSILWSAPREATWLATGAETPPCGTGRCISRYLWARICSCRRRSSSLGVSSSSSLMGIPIVKLHFGPTYAVDLSGIINQVQGWSPLLEGFVSSLGLCCPPASAHRSGLISASMDATPHSACSDFGSHLCPKTYDTQPPGRLLFRAWAVHTATGR